MMDKDFREDVIGRLARIEEKILAHPPCDMVRSLSNRFWAALIAIIAILLPLALVGVTK